METMTAVSAWTKVCEVELIYKQSVKPSERPVAKTSRQTYEIAKAIWNEDLMDMQEEFKILLLNTSLRVLGVYHVASGGLKSVTVDERLVMACALKGLATGMILLHNHPSGSLKPSEADQRMTYKIQTACQYFGISLLDHIIITSEGYYSFADEGLL